MYLSSLLATNHYDIQLIQHNLQLWAKIKSITISIIDIDSKKIFILVNISSKDQLTPREKQLSVSVQRNDSGN